jgi:L-threonylcarbamoyladenylate synthase
MYRTINQKTLDQALTLLNAGQVIAIPTETVYGLAADASQINAVKKIFQIKGRPENHPLIVHIQDASQLEKWAVDIPEYVKKLTTAFWPGPLALILKKAKHVNDIVTGGQKTIALRAPNHPIAQSLLKALGGGLAAPSANTFGKISPSLASHVKKDLGPQLKMIIDGGPCSIGIESTIIACFPNHIELLRPGKITADEIHGITGILPTPASKTISQAPGTLDKHYAPRTPLSLFSQNNLNSLLETIIQENKPTTILSFKMPKKMARNIHWIRLPEDIDAFTHHFYALLHQADQLDTTQLYLEKVPNTPQWDAVRNRIERAIT